MNCIGYARKIALPRDCIEQIISDYKKIECAKMLPQLDEIKRSFFEGALSEDKLGLLAAKSGITDLMAKLIFSLWVLDTTKEIFITKGLSEKVFYDSITDISIWVNVCKMHFNEWGLNQYAWISRTLRGNLYRFGRLQFETEAFLCDSYDKGDVHLKKGDPVINVHIPEGAPMTKEERIKSYRTAREYFKNNVFVCESFFLYPPQKDYLPENSNIRSFMDEYDIIRYEEKPGNGDMWRIFGPCGHYRSRNSELPRNTSLQRAFADFLVDHNTGEGYGVMIFND